MASELTIGKLAESAGVNIETIRYYQRAARWLSQSPLGAIGAIRRMRPNGCFIKRAQALGFTLMKWAHC